MGIDYTALHTIMLSLKDISPLNVLTLGRQGIHISQNSCNQILSEYNRSSTSATYNAYCEDFFRDLGTKNVSSIDASKYENCTIVCDLNKPVSKDLHGKFDYIYDGGTIEHIFLPKDTTKEKGEQNGK